MTHPTQGQNPIPVELAQELAPVILRDTVCEPDGCWIRTKSVKSNGYTHVSRRVDGERRYYLAHRVMLVATTGVDLSGLTVDHVCEVRACCNPEHLRASEHHKNVLRSRNNPYAINARKTHCIHGHELPPYKRGGKRKCAECRRIASAEYRSRRAGVGA